jgi:hypothetical protein
VRLRNFVAQVSRKVGDNVNNFDGKLLQVGDVVPDFEMDTYEPKSSSFGKLSLADLKAKGKWTVLAGRPCRAIRKDR